MREELISEHGDYPDMFEDLMAGVDRSVEFTRFYVQNKIPESVDCDGYLITGSRHSVYEDLSWIKELVNFIKHVLASRRKIIGVCFGHQLMAHYFGGLVEKSVKGWAVGVHKSNLVARQSWMDKADFREDVSLLSSHQDQVVRLPEEATLYATNEFCPIAGFVVGDQVLTIQGHPEFDKEYAVQTKCRTFAPMMHSELSPEHRTRFPPRDLGERRVPDELGDSHRGVFSQNHSASFGFNMT